MKKIVIAFVLLFIGAAFYSAMTDPEFGRSTPENQKTARGSEPAGGGAEPSRREIERAVQAKMQRVVERVAKKSNGVVPQVSTSTDITGCTPYGADSLCQLKVVANIEGERLARDYTMRLTKTPSGWVERDDEISGMQKRPPLEMIHPAMVKDAWEILLAEPPSFNDTVVFLVGAAGEEFELTLAGARPQVISALQNAQAGDCLSMLPQPHFDHRSAAQILTVYSCRPR